MVSSPHTHTHTADTSDYQFNRRKECVRDELTDGSVSSPGFFWGGELHGFPGGWLGNYTQDRKKSDVWECTAEKFTVIGR